jgi:hypothetical protein
MGNEKAVARKASHVHNGVTYRITVHAEPTGYSGRWECESNSDSGPIRALHSIDGVIKAAKLLIHQHYLKHRKPRRT